MLDRKAQNFAPGTIIFYRTMLSLFAKFCEARAITTIDQISPDELRRYLNWLEETGHNPGGIHAAYRAVKTFMRWLWDELEPEGKNPIEKVKAPRLAIEPLDPANLDDVGAMLAVCNSDFHGLRDKAIMLFLLDTGARAAECLALDLDDCDLVTGAILIRVGKGRKPRTVFTGQKTRKALRAYLKLRHDTNPAVWVTAQGERLGYVGLRAVMTRRAETAKVKPPELHSFRRAFALGMLRNGVDVYSLQSLMGHSDLQVLRRYLKQTDSDLAAAHRKGSPVDSMGGKNGR
ncbi:MAG: tyrosine-type recombinase/integrase [Anaerolineales bacterium]|nr:tyrosine-type recombinase/integrase [Anaerolineales bacterium]